MTVTLPVAKKTNPVSATPTNYEFECTLSPAFLDNLAVMGTETTQSAAQSGVDATDDLRLEAYFLQQALSAVVVARKRLQSCGRVFTRPPTYHAHLLKTTAHLQRVKSAADEAARQVTAAAEARRQRHLRAVGKKVQQERRLERDHARSSEIKAVEAVRRKTAQRIRSVKNHEDGDMEDEDRQPVESVIDRIVSKRPATKGHASHKRNAKNARFGFGGKERKMAKRNTAESVNDMSSFSASRNKSSFFARDGQKGRKPTSGKDSKNRPGKARRVQTRNRKNQRK